MHLNSIKPAEGAKRAKSRVGRGIGSGLGKTAGRGHKGQKSRAGSGAKWGFEGGQMPLHRRVPKFGFNSRKSFLSTELRMSELNNVDAEIIDLGALKAAKVINRNVKQVKVFAHGKITKAINLRGIAVSKGAKAAIEAAGGKVE